MTGGPGTTPHGLFVSRTNRTTMRLGFHYHIPAHRLPSGEIVTSGPLGRFLDALASRCEELVCFLHSPRQDEIPYLDHVLQATNLRWISAGKHRSVPWRTAWSHRITRPLAEGRGQLDGVLLRGPSPLLPAFARAARPLPTTLLLVGDYLAGVDDLPQPRWRKELIRKWARWNAARQRDVARTSLTLVNSSDLYETFRDCSPLLRQVRTSTLNESDFRWRDDSCGEQPVHLLYSGRMDRGKGLLVMVAAVGLLVRRGFNVVLDLVGPPQPGDPVLDEVASTARAWRVEQRVVYHGFRVLGEDLFRHYRKADIYLSASLATEGFPRSIWEAMAHSVPVVASRVGSIPRPARGRRLGPPGATPFRRGFGRGSARHPSRSTAAHHAHRQRLRASPRQHAGAKHRPDLRGHQGLDTSPAASTSSATGHSAACCSRLRPASLGAGFRFLTLDPFSKPNASIDCR